MAPIVPKLRVPFQISGNKAEVIEQDSDEEIAQCVEAVLKTVIGTRIDRSEFGVPDLAFRTAPGSLPAVVRKAVERWEPRADVALIEEIANTDQTLHVNLGSEE